MDDDESLQEDREIVRRRGHFTLFLVSTTRDLDLKGPLPAHENVLRPLLKIATDCFVYGIKPGSRIGKQSKHILISDGRRHRINLAGEPIQGHELLWNADGGERGSIVILCSARRFGQLDIFRHCYEASIMLNPGAAHTPAALRLAKEKARDRDGMALCLSRNNGIEWMDVFTAPETALDLFDRAVKQHQKQRRS